MNVLLKDNTTSYKDPDFQERIIVCKYLMIIFKKINWHDYLR